MTEDFTVHSMMHIAEAKISGLADTVCSSIDAGYKFSPEGSNCRVMISGGTDDGEQAWKLMIYGGTSTEEVNRYLEELKEAVKESEGTFELTESSTITNLAVSGELDRELNLEQISVEMTRSGVEFEYEPEQFPALVLYMDEPDCTFLLFSTGSYVIQGLNDFDDIPVALGELKKVLEYSPSDIDLF
jgi:hypothetical protein